MDIERMVAVQSAVDEEVVFAEIEGFVRGWVPGIDPVSAPRARWRIQSLGAADWAMVKVAEVDAIVRRYADEIDRWSRARTDAAKAGIWLSERLKEWAIESRTDNTKTFRLAHGEVGTREQKPKAMIVDESVALEWAHGHDQSAIKKTEEFQISKCSARLVECVRLFVITDRHTGEVSELPVDPDSPLYGDDAAKTLEDLGVTAQAVIELRVLTVDGRPYPGLGVKDGKITATVSSIAAF